MALKINWTPWFNVPMHRRLELFSVGILTFFAFGLVPFTLSAIFYILVNKFFFVTNNTNIGVGLKTLRVVHLSFIFTVYR